MNTLRKYAFRLLIILALMGLVIPAAAQAPQPALQGGPGHATKFLPVPDEIRSRFEGGIPLEQFLALNAGRLPNAVQALAGREVSVMIELQAEPLAAFYARQLQNNAAVTTEAQQAHASALQAAQDSVAQQVEALGGRVISQYTKAYNGLLVRMPAGQLANLRSLAEVKGIRRAPRHVPALANSVAHIRATEVIEELGFDGTGTTIAIIDTGVDYTHAAFGGAGTPEAYEANDPATIEEGSFPTEKVIGGWDFAGPNYDPESDDPALNTPSPDPDPLDGDGHGTHVAHTAAGFEVAGQLGHGVAPGAQIYALKVFGDLAASTEVAVNAIEWALDPNQDNDLSDHVDVINMSLGSFYGIADQLDPEIVAVDYATLVGVVVVASAGNNGDVSYITGSPAAADTAISVAASTTGFITGPTISLAEGGEGEGIVYAPGSFGDNTGRFEEPLTAPLAYAGDFFEDDLLCEVTEEAVAAQPMAGHIALIQRGTCAFSDKVNHAAHLGAVAAIIFNNEAGGNTLVNMVGDPVEIPAGFVAREHGLQLVEAAGQTVTISAETDVTTLVDPFLPADTIADFSSRGPRALDAFQKPDVTAPGVGIYAAKVGSGTEGTSYSGTSMAAPHVAGVAALVRQAHPDWAPEQVKAALMNTAVDLQIGSAEVPRQGAGRVDAYRAVTTDAFAIGDLRQVSLSWGILETDQPLYQDTKNIMLHDLSGEERAYRVSVEWGEESMQAGMTLSVPETVQVGAGSIFAHVPVEMSIDTTQVPVEYQQLEEYYGYVVLTPQGEAAPPLRVPFYVIPQPYSQLAFTDIRIRERNATVEIAQQGPAPSSLWAYPLYEISDNNPDQLDMADLRLVGMDFGFTHEEYGDIFIPAINVYGPWFTPQPYFAEFDLLLDVNGDGSPDLANFNWNAGAAFGTGDDSDWVVVQVDLATGEFFLGSPFLIYTDYNSGYMEWALPAEWNGLTEGDTNFDWQLAAFDANGSSDVTAVHHFDLAHPPIAWELSNPLGPDNPTTTLRVRIADMEGVRKTQPLGLMLVDYNGKPGVGQAYALTPDQQPPFGLFVP